MSWMDITVCVVIVGALIVGYHRGMIKQIISVAGLFIAYVAAYAWYDDVSPWISGQISMASFESYQKYEFVVKGLNLDVYFANALAFAIIFFGVKLGLTCSGYFLSFVAKAPGLNFMNQWAGAALAFAEAIVMVVIAVHIMTIIPSDSVQKLLSESYTAEFVMQHAPMIADQLQELWNEGIHL